MLIFLKRSTDWLLSRPSYLLLTGDDAALEADPRRFAGAWRGLLLQAVFWGVMSATVWNQAWGLFGEVTGLKIMPAAATAAVLCLWPYRRAVLSVGQILSSRPAEQALVAAAVAGLLATAILSTPSDWTYGGPYPQHATVRVLLLMPLWGAWAMMIASQICRQDDRAERVVAVFARGCGPIAASLSLALPAGASWLYLGHLSWLHWVPLLAAAVAGPAWGLICCRAAGGLRRSVLLAANILTQLVFLLAYIFAMRKL